MAKLAYRVLSPSLLHEEMQGVNFGNVGKALVPKDAVSKAEPHGAAGSLRHHDVCGDGRNAAAPGVVRDCRVAAIA